MKRAFRIPRVDDLCAEQIVASAGDTGAVLVDPFGRSMPLAEETCVGRDPDVADLAILQASVSRQHAVLRRSGERWEVADVGSTNGTWLDGRRVRETPSAIEDEQLVVFGDVGFIFLTDGTKVQQVTASIAATERRPAAGTLRLIEPTRGGGGLAEYQGDRVQLGSTQFALLLALAERYIEDAEVSEDVRGYIQSIELLVTLPWDTPSPQNNHLKQLVRRVRRALEKIDLVDAIESRQRFGYRLTVHPKVVNP